MSLCSSFTQLLLTRFKEMPLYAVRAGKKPGVYKTWPECQKQVTNFKYAKYRKFDTEQEAVQFVNGFDSPGGGTATTPSKASSRLSHTTHARISPYGVRLTPSSLSSASSPTPTSPVASIDYQLLITEEELSLLKEKLTMLENKKALLLKEKALEQKKIGLSKDQVNSNIKEEPFRQKLDFNHKSGRKEISSGSWSQNKTTKLIDIKGTRKCHTGVTQSESSGGRAVVYTDGSCCGNGKTDARAGIGVYWGEDHPFNVSEKLHGRQTNNRAEIFAVVKALQQAKQMGLKEVVVKTDSQFIINSMTMWVKSWIKKDWKTASGKPVINKDDFLALLKEMKDITVIWEHVYGHTGNEGNECADRLAVAGANMT